MSEINNGHWLTALDRTYMFAHMIEECLLTELVIEQHDEFRNIVQQVCDRYVNDCPSMCNYKSFTCP